MDCKGDARSQAEVPEHRGGEHPKGDAGQMALVGLFMAVWITDSFAFGFTTGPLGIVPWPARVAALCACLAAAFLLFLSGHRVVEKGRRLSAVVSTGAFGYVRHPLYLASMLSLLGLSASTGSLASLGCLVPVFVFYDCIAAYEERVMEGIFGDEYRSYKARTGKWVPWISRGRRESGPDSQSHG